MYAITQRERIFTLAGLFVALFLGALDQTIVATAMPHILQELNGLSLYTWVVTGYLLASTAMIPIYGKLSDLFGRKAIVLTGVVIFLAGSALSGQSRTMTELVAFRALQGLGSAGIFSMAFTVVGDIFSPVERGKYQGLFGGVFGIASVLGPWLGGLLTDNLSWRWVFYVNVPLGVLAIAFILTQMPPLKPALTKAPRIDWGGAVTLILGVVPLLLALSLGGNEYPWGSWPILGLFAIGAVGIAAFVWVEKKADEPIVPFELFGNRTFVIGNAAALLITGVAFFAAILFLPIFMVLVTGATASEAGLTLTPLTLGMVASSILAGQIVSRTRRYKVWILAGIAVVFVGYIAMNTITAETTQAQMTWRMIILGVGLGPALPIFTLAIQNSVDPRRMGVATSSSQFFRQIGSTLGIAVFGTLLTTTLGAQIPKYLPAELQQSSASGAVTAFDANELQSGNLDAVGVQVRKGMDAVYAKVERALGGDAEARQSLLADPRVPAEMKATLPEGGIPAAVRQQVDGEYAAVERALKSGRPEELDALLASPLLPTPLKEQLGRIPRAALRSPQAVAGILTQVRQGLDASEPAIVKQVSDQALSQVRQALDTQAATLTVQLTTALKKAFTDSIKRLFFWGLFVVALGFILTLFLPELALREQRATESAGASAGAGTEGLPPHS